MESSTEPDPLLRPVRAGVAILLALAVLNGAFLYLLPSSAEAEYAWSIALPVSAAFMGAGYLAGMVATGLGVFAARYWRSLRALVPGFCLLGLVLFAATMVHADQFRWSYAPTWVWTLVYAVLPLAATGFWILQERAAGAPPERDDRLPALRPLGVLGVTLGVLGLALCVAPDALLEKWPWEISPLLARVFAGWYLLAGGTLIVAAVSVRRAHEIPIPSATIATWSILVLLLPLLYSDSVRTDGAGLWALIGLHATALAASVFALARSVGLLRADCARI